MGTAIKDKPHTTPLAGTEAFPLSPDGYALTSDLINTLGLPVFNVKSAAYGAIGNGIADDTTAIQSAITACGAAGGGIVLLPAGTYLISTGLTITTAATILSGIAEGATTLYTTSSIDMITITGPAVPAVAGGVMNMTITANGTKASFAVVVGLSFEPILENLMIHHFAGTGAGPSASFGVSVGNCSNLKARGISMSDGGYLLGTGNASVYFSDCWSVLAPTYAWYVAGHDVFLDYCEGDDTTYGLYITSAIGDIRATQFVADGISVAGFYVEANATNRQVNIDGGWVAGNGAGIVVHNSANVNISGVTVNGVASSAFTTCALFDTCTNCSLIGCTFVGAASTAVIEVTASEECTIVGNAFQGYAPDAATTACGILVTGSSSNITVIANVLGGTDITITNGIQVASGCSKVIISGNVIKASVITNGIVIASGLTGIVCNGNPAYSSAVTAPSVTSGSAFTPSATADSMLYLTYATAGSVTSVTMGPSTGAENTVYGQSIVGVTGFSQSLRVPIGWKVVVTTVTATIAASVVTL